MPLLQQTDAKQHSDPSREGELSTDAAIPRAPVAVSAPAQYDEEAFVAATPDSQLPGSSVALRSMLSFDSQKRNNLHVLDSNTLLLSAGCSVVLLDLQTRQQHYFRGRDGGGIGAIAVHPSRQFFAVAEKCQYRPPNIYIYQYPSLRLARVLQHGTEQAYSAVSFDHTGTKLAAVGAYPDYMLSTWDWQQEQIMLRSKAFSQEVYRVSFSPYLDGLLTTSGTGHIRFWKMATTFTGLKLQGQIGKFGNVDLTDVAAFLDLPDGKVLCSTECGDLLLWSAGLIKMVIKRPGDQPCHDGPIEVVMLDSNTRDVLTAGADGYVRRWDLKSLAEAEAGEDSSQISVAPLEEILLGPGIHIKTLLAEPRCWFIQDQAGGLLKVELPAEGKLAGNTKVTRLLDFHSGAITGLATLACSHQAVTIGADGSVRLHDYRSRKLLYKRTFNQAALCLCLVPASLDPSGRTLLVGFADGMLRCLLRCADDWKLAAACKPHKGAIRVVALSPDNKLLVTASEDSTLFFFRVAGATKLQPLCCTSLHGPVTCLSWAHDSATVLVGCRNGDIVELAAPPTNIDTSSSFLQQLPTRFYDFRRPQPPLQPPTPTDIGEAAADADPNSELLSPGAGTAPASTPHGDDAAAQALTEDEGGYPVICLMHVPGSRDGRFYVTLAGAAAGQVYECHIDSEDVLASHASLEAPTSLLKYTASQRFLLSGSADGRVRVMPAAAHHSTFPSGRFWEAALHDSQSGAVTGAATSFDDAYLLSVAHDGTFSVQDVLLDGVEAQDGDLEALPSSALDLTAEVPDTTDPHSYTIEEALQKTGEDQMRAAAEAKKLTLREELDQIRRDFEALLAENDARPPAERLPAAEFEIDVGLRALMEEENQRKEEIARMELAWEGEKQKVALAKLKKRFLDHLEVERIKLTALKSGQCVTSFRTARLPDSLIREIKDVKSRIDTSANAQYKYDAYSPTKTRNMAGGSPFGPASGRMGSMANPSEGLSRMASLANLDEKQVSKQEQRRLARKKREAEWAAFKATKPDDSFENPADADAIDEAERNMGDFKLKSDPSYVVPEAQRVNTQSKRRQMLLLEEAMYRMKMEFNKRFLALRDVKKRVCSEIGQRNVRLREVNAVVGIAEEPFQPVLGPEETPEAREVVTEADLQAFAAKQQQAAKNSLGSGFASGATDAPTAPAVKLSTKAAAGAAGKASSGKENAESLEAAQKRVMASMAMSDLERAEQQLLVKRAEYERQRLLGEVADMAQAFDGALAALRRDKFILEADLKQAEIKRLVLYQELTLLKDSEKREVALNSKLAGKMEEVGEVVARLEEAQDKLAEKTDELRMLVEKKQMIVTEFDGLVEESHPQREALAKTFNRKIKRAKKKVTGPEADSESESESEDEAYDEADLDFDDEEEEACPPGCDQSLYDKVCDLREQRLDEEDRISEVNKAIELLKKEKETISKKQKVIDSVLKAINDEIIEFQKEKQGKLNEIDVTVTLRLHQIEFLEAGQLPEDLSQALVFSDRELARLQKRIQELGGEKGDLRQAQQELKREHIQLLRDLRTKQQKVAELEARAVDVQMLKFGQIIDLDVLDRVGSTKGAEDLRQQLKQQEAQQAKELTEWDNKVKARTDELAALTRENTSCLTAVANLTRVQKSLETSLATTQTKLFSDPIAQRRREVAERDELVRLVNAQARELEGLKAQVYALRSKGSPVHLY
ncbi:hypothetical protein WJX72_008037 [[Myrmecia] bisecta]|uniref:Cilia- and flagella-associated protein 44 n=1 Tax=[Myrmecia] bisecta TaxID=41462 RepID=A0AAW1PTG5_9CHLO